ncbi:MAG: DUF4783 domain-containing protein [Bacteroidetes bacterium]|jgi:hypothetical protein|nr:DUF4783 domain-containing protein [Bacteroidota bacterium]
MLPPIFVAVAAAFAALAARPAEDASRLTRLFSEGNSEEIAKSFSASVQLTTPGKQGVYSKSQARMILSGFFEQHTPGSAKSIQQGKSENGANFLVISLSTQSGEYKTTVFYRGSGKTMSIHELKIEK